MNHFFSTVAGYSNRPTIVAPSVFLAVLVCLLVYFNVLVAEIFPGTRHPEMRGPPRGWDREAIRFQQQPSVPAMQGPEASFGILLFLNKRQFGGCPSGAPIEVSPQHLFSRI